MGSGPSQTTSSTSTSQPWAPTEGLLNQMIGTLGQNPMMPSTAQSTAAQNLVNATGTLPNFGGTATGGVNNLLTGGGANSFSPLYQNAYDTTSSQLAPTANPASINPMNNPAIRSLINTTNNDTTNSIDSQWAAAGMTGSPGNAQALARGISQGESGILTGQYNTDVTNQMNASNSLNAAANTNAAGQSNLNQLSLQNILSGMQGASAIPGLLTQPQQAQLGAANTQSQLPYQNLGWLSQLLYPMAALGGQSAGNSTTQGSQSMLSNILGGVMGGAGALGAIGTGMGGSGGMAAALPQLMAMSDERTKEDIHPVGMLFDDTNIYSFRYKADPTHTERVGVMAQEIEKTKPDAVREIGGVKFVDYGKVTGIGMLRMAA